MAQSRCKAAGLAGFRQVVSARNSARSGTWQCGPSAPSEALAGGSLSYGCRRCSRNRRPYRRPPSCREAWMTPASSSGVVYRRVSVLIAARQLCRLSVRPSSTGRVKERRRRQSARPCPSVGAGSYVGRNWSSRRGRRFIDHGGTFEYIYCPDVQLMHCSGLIAAARRAVGVGPGAGDESFTPGALHDRLEETRCCERGALCVSL
jgi:hypothetical protein